ncbi:MAG: Flp pilus assembly protein CpaB [Sedimentibacter saalensis]|uniref:Flp pilus assembly protein CpaB n=1 Tax=Sedimentibacter saalensis TaxID=130788 RepID=UPI003158AC09
MKKVKIIALIAAVIFAVLLYNFLNKVSEPTIVEISKSGVIVATVDIAPNIPITQDMVKLVEMPDESIHQQSVKEINEVLGKIATSEIINGEQVLSTKLIVPGEGNGTLAYKIEPGMRAITVSVSNITGLSNMIIPDNKVDIIGQYEVEVDTPSDEEKTIDYTTMLLENVKVLAVDNIMTEQEKNDSDVAYVSLTLEVTPLQAMEVSMSEYKGAIRAVLRSPLDEGITSLPALTVDKVIFKNK